MSDESMKMKDDEAAAAAAAAAITSLDDEEYKKLRPYAFHLQLPSNHKTAGGVPYATIYAHRKSRALVKLVDSLTLKEHFFVDNRNGKEGEEEEEEEGLGEEGTGPKSLFQFTLHCKKIQSHLTFLSDIKHNYGLSQYEVCNMLLKILDLLCATVEIVEEGEVLEEGVSSMVIDNDGDGKAKKQKRKVALHYDNVGYILGGGGGGDYGGKEWGKQQTTANTTNEFEESLTHPFALPSPARQTLLNVAFDLLGEKNGLRGVSNAAIRVDSVEGGGGGGGNGGLKPQPMRMFVSHRALLRMLLRTAPYLDERKLDVPPHEAGGLKRAELKRTVNLIKSCRLFFDQGGLPSSPSPADATARSLWNALSADLRYHTHSNSCFRALIIMYLFHPSKCSEQYYTEVLPIWMECWRGVDRCPEWDYLWMVLFSRARKHLSPTPSNSAIRSTLRKHLLTSCGFWLQIPMGGVSSDKSFPQARFPARRSFPSRLKSFVGTGGRYEEGMDFVARLCKLLMYCAGPTAAAEMAVADVEGVKEDDGLNKQLVISEETSDILRFLSFVAPYYNPSNTGGWAFPLGAFVYYLAYELGARLGITAGWEILQRDYLNVARQLVEEEPYLKCIELPGNEIVAFLDRLLPLCQQALYSKIPTVSHAGEMALLYLVQIDPARVSPPLIEFSLRALDISSVNLSHQAPAALSVLSCLLKPALRAKSSIVLSRLPMMLRLTLAGIDSNDQEKSLRTLVFYRNLVMWIPVGGPITLPKEGDPNSSVLDCDGKDGTMQIGKQLTETRYGLVESEKYKTAVASLPENSILFAQQAMEDEYGDDGDGVLMQEAMLAMTDWSLAFLERIYELLRAAGEQEKLGKGQGGTGMRHTSADVAMSKNFSRIMKETLTYLFAAMDDSTYEAALRSVANFVQEETLPFAVKDASLLCQAVCATRFVSGGSSSGNTDPQTMDRSPGLDALVPILTEDVEHMSKKSAIYRLRCLSGAVRYAGSTVLKHRVAITSAITFALSKSDDRVLFKTGCKLLRHSLSSQCEEYPIAQGVHPMRLNNGTASRPVLGTSALLHGDRVWWHVPSGEQIDFTVSLLLQFALKRWKDLGSPSVKCETAAGNVNLQQWRQSLRVLRYTLRGCSGILLDEDPEIILTRDQEICPREIASATLLLRSSIVTRKALRGLRRRLCFNLLDIISLIAKDTVDCESVSSGEESETRQYKKNETGSISTDPKICNEAIAITSIILTRRGAQYRSGSGKSILQGQQEILTDWSLTHQADFISSILSRSNDDLFRQINDLYYEDGENSGRTISRALLVNSIHLANQALTASASSQVPRRLRKLRGGPSAEKPESIFSLDISLKSLEEQLCESEPYSPELTSLEACEALVDGLSAMSCHPNINVRGKALSNTDFAITRFGWVVKHKRSRYLAAISLNDDGQKGVHGIPSCSQLVNQINSQGKRTRLAEVVKGVAKIVALPKVTNQFLWGASNRYDVVKTLCGTQKLLKLLPPEEVPKVIHYVNSIFLSYRSVLFALPRNTGPEQETHESCLAFLLSILQPDEVNNVTADPDKNLDDDAAGAMHWRDRLVAAWFILQFIDERDLMDGDSKIVSQVWSTCFKLIETEQGQPLQRVALGLLGRLVSLALVDMSQISDISNMELKCPDLSELRALFLDASFCRAFGNALAFDHREDSSVGGGHSAQWSSGVEEIIRDATSNLARRTLFPFNRISQKSRTFKLQHSQLIESILLAIGHENAKATSCFLLGQARELVASPPSEDQRNQLVTSAEIFGGCARALIQYSNTEDERTVLWETMFLPFLEEAVVKMPVGFLSAFYDASRYAIHHFPPDYFFPLLKWSVAKVQNTLWQHEGDEDVEESNGAASAMSDRFALQGKWLLLYQAVLVELDSEDDLGAAVCKLPWYSDIFIGKKESKEDDKVKPVEIELGQSWNYVTDHLTPCLLKAISHPYEKCRDHISACLFRICYCHRKIINTCKALGNENRSKSSDDPGIEIMNQLSSIRDTDRFSFKEKNRALGTARKFVSCCVHWGDMNHEFPDFIIPLLPLSFQSLQTLEGEVSPEDRGIEADLVKGYRYAISDISSSCVACYGVAHDMTLVLNVLKGMSSHECWQIRQATAHFLRCFQGAHKFLFTEEQDNTSLCIAISLLADDRREVSTAATSALTGILAVFPQAALKELVSKYIQVANKSWKKKKKRKTSTTEISAEESEIKAVKEKERAVRQQRSVFVLCAVVMGRPYDTPTYVPEALAALSKHSFEQRASLSVREVVKMVCSEFKRTHTDNWEAHRKQFTQEQLEALEDVVSIPHYYA